MSAPGSYRPTHWTQGPAGEALTRGHQGQASPLPFCYPESLSLKKDEVTSDGTLIPWQVPPQESQTEQIKEKR